MRTVLAILLVIVAAVASPATANDKAFNDLWYDGQAELSGYKVTVSRYGEERVGTCVLIYVTEPFNSAKRVKADGPGPDVFNALKLNMVRDFQTGIYDYNTMSSVFVHDDDFKISKQTFSSAEWCGHVYEDVVFYDDKIKGHYYSYFEDESGDIEDDAREDGVTEESLWILLRGLRGDFMEPGQTQEIKLWPSALWRRLSHGKTGWVDARVSRDDKLKTVTVPAGDFEVMVYRIESSDGREGAFYIETAYPHRVIRWNLLPDVSAEMTGSQRLPYWRLNHNGHEEYLDKIGLPGGR